MMKQHVINADRYPNPDMIGGCIKRGVTSMINTSKVIHGNINLLVNRVHTTITISISGQPNVISPGKQTCHKSSLTQHTSKDQCKTIHKNPFLANSDR